LSNQQGGQMGNKVHRPEDHLGGAKNLSGKDPLDRLLNDDYWDSACVFDPAGMSGSPVRLASKACMATWI
jgi:hypothetical protein